MWERYIGQKLPIDGAVTQQHGRAKSVHQRPPCMRSRLDHLSSHVVGINHDDPVVLKNVRQRALARTNAPCHSKTLHKPTVVGRGKWNVASLDS